MELADENYADINPPFKRKRRLKIGTFKVTSNGYKLGERFLKIIFDNALKQKVEEIYVTIFDKRQEQVRLIKLLEEWGFNFHGTKTTVNGDEVLFVKKFVKGKADPANPKKTYPFLQWDSSFFIVPIYPEYHTELFPDSMLRTESAMDFVENKPHRNAVSKVYISRSYERRLDPGDLIVFYRTGGVYGGVATTVGIVESVVTDIPDEATFVALCRKRSVFTDDELKEHWNFKKNNRPFIVNFLYSFSYAKRPTLKWLNEKGIIPNVLDMPRGFRRISKEDFITIAEYSRNV
ncbi:EVE domain-containing protein [Arcticibacter pallidicorallinus]|uniref:EVE domain-containing protein n=1 Tax=Arcticibacter pallidicorallinus TaxID=1259464 RepID=UPI001C637777|nr:EVE domain-containing protein [Arcticibacter pallidicorallinus]